MGKKITDISSNSDKNAQDIYSSGKQKKSGKDRKNGKKRGPVKKVLIAIGKAIVALFLVGVITGSIVVTALTVYVMKATETDSTISLDKDDVQTTGITTVYGKNSAGEWIPLSKISSGTKMIWVDIVDVPDHVKNAFVAIEDKTFYEHKGVNFQRTFLAFANMILHFWDTEQGGSTITQQLIKNITNDDDKDAARKVREIFKAMSLERTYSKDQILQAYVNIISIGGNNGDYRGLATAARLYFNKDVSQLTIAEAASIAGITKSPVNYNPIENPENNKKRRNLVLENMHDQGMITDAEYQEAVNSEVVVNKGTVVGITDGKEYQSYFVDNVINQVIRDLQKETGCSEKEASEKVKTGGYDIYTTIDIDLQDKLEKEYLDASNFSNKNLDPELESAMVIYDLNGAMKAVVGGRGPKGNGDRNVINRATKSQRSPGSSIKPLSAYALAIDENMYNYSSILDDNPIKDNEKGKPWPSNYSGKYQGNVPLQYAVEKSINTIPTKIVEQLTPKKSLNFLTNKLGFTDLDLVNDANPAPMGMGSLTVGVHLNELTNAYQIFGNGGRFTESYCYTEVLNNAGEQVLKPDTVSTQVISEESSSIMNRLLRTVITEKEGTGKAASMDKYNIDVVGKTGTTTENNDYTFVGITPYYVAGVWVGYNQQQNLDKSPVYSSSKIWYNVMSDIYKDMEPAQFELSGKMITAAYCTQSGLLARGDCPQATGYYKSDHMPSTCTDSH